jgi:hypothetical protein
MGNGKNSLTSALAKRNEGMTLVKGWVDVHAHFTPPVTEEQRLKQWEGMR